LEQLEIDGRFQSRRYKLRTTFEEFLFFGTLRTAGERQFLQSWS